MVSADPQLAQRVVCRVEAATAMVALLVVVGREETVEVQAVRLGAEGAWVA